MGTLWDPEIWCYGVAADLRGLSNPFVGNVAVCRVEPLCSRVDGLYFLVVRVRVSIRVRVLVGLEDGQRWKKDRVYRP